MVMGAGTSPHRESPRSEADALWLYTTMTAGVALVRLTKRPSLLHLCHSIGVRSHVNRSSRQRVPTIQI
jgi:hypothetical protein